MHDVKLAFRALRATPVVSIVAALSLALGIGANTAIFTVINAVLLRPLPFRDPARLVLLIERTSRFPTVTTSWQNYVDWRDQMVKTYAGLASEFGFLPVCFRRWR